MAKQKQAVLDLRYAQHPERFVNGAPTVPLPPTFVAINPLYSDEGEEMLTDRVNFPTLTAAGYVKEEEKLMVS
ncbi:MAG: hypothetical protein Q9O24_08860 [Gammaproteobacteria bacterium]|nr:hypothetical protein [Gammaproteobacteria bacterium]